MIKLNLEMKRTIGIFVLMLTLSIAGFAQNGEGSNNRKEQFEGRMESMKIAYITEELDLTTEEAQSFWPLFNEYSAKMKALKEDKKSDRRPMEMSEAEAEKYLQDLISYKEDELAIQKEYVAKMKKVIPSKKVAELFILESRFREKMVKRIKDRMGRREKRMRQNRKN